MTTIKEYNVKIKNLKNTRKITKTMKIVSANKLRKAHIAQSNAKLYEEQMTHLISRLSHSVDPTIHPFLKQHDQAKKALLLLITSDKGLCGAFNNNVIKRAASWIEENRHQYEVVDLSCCGKRGHRFFNKRKNVRTHYKDMTDTPKIDDAMTIAGEISECFLKGEYDEVYLVYNQFMSPLSQEPVFEKVLPIDPHLLMEERFEKPIDYLFEPKAKQLLEFLIPHFLYFKIYFSLLENAAGEHGARMTAMDNATQNALELIDLNTLFRNRARQAAITAELAEIISGAELIQ